MKNGILCIQFGKVHVLHPELAAETSLDAIGADNEARIGHNIEIAFGIIAFLYRTI